MIDPAKAVTRGNETPTPSVATLPRILSGVGFGFAFGFLLQKGGVGKFHILIGQLLLEDWTVAKIMLTAILVGMVGIFALNHMAKVNLHIKPTRIASNIIGGLLFGAGFAFAGYCPGTAAAGLGQGSWDALFTMVGLVAGSWLFAELSAYLKRTLEMVGDLGKITLPDVLNIPRGIFVALFAVLLFGGLIIMERMFPR
jgi:hypothetical protein